MAEEAHAFIPDEVLGIILMKSSDSKSLICCSLVSKHFASVLFRLPSLYLQLRSSLSFPDTLFPFFNNAFLLGLTKLVSRFTSAWSLHIELLSDCPQLPFTPNHPFSWDFNVGHYLKTIAICSNSSMKKMDKEGSESQEPRITAVGMGWTLLRRGDSLLNTVLCKFDKNRC